ncbi:tripartite tricarboxylate transporter substrate binding protein, partial [Alcaligenes pakistanensis]
ALQKTLAKPEFKTQLEQQGSQVYTGTQDEYQNFIAAERSKWQRIVQTAEISLE